MFKLFKRFLGLASAYNEAERKYGKKWYKSKTVWVNAIALLSIFLGDKVGVPLSEEDKLAILSVINIALRIVTKEPVRW